MDSKTRVGAGGRVVIPAEFRRALGLEVGDEVILTLEGGSLRILTPAEAVARAQATVRRFVPAASRLADELIAERRAEAEGTS